MRLDGCLLRCKCLWDPLAPGMCHRPSDLEDVEEAYLRSGCSCATAVPIADGQDVLGVLLLGQPAGHFPTDQ